MDVGKDLNFISSAEEEGQVHGAVLATNSLVFKAMLELKTLRNTPAISTGVLDNLLR